MEDAENTGNPDDPDVVLDVPTLQVEEIDLEVEDLHARVSLQAEVLDLLKLNVGADVDLGKVQLTIKGVEAQALLKVRLDNVAAIIERVLETIDNNPEIIQSVTHAVGTAAGEVGRGASSALGELGQGAGGAVEGVGREAGAAAGELADAAGGAVRDAGGAAGQAVAATTGEGVQEKRPKKASSGKKKAHSGEEPGTRKKSRSGEEPGTGKKARSHTGTHAGTRVGRSRDERGRRRVEPP